MMIARVLKVMALLLEVMLLLGVLAVAVLLLYVFISILVSA